MSGTAQHPRTIKKRTADGRCYDGRTNPPEGCCLECWHESGLERPGRLFLHSLVEKAFYYCSHHAGERARSADGAIPLEDFTVPRRPHCAAPAGACSACWEEGQRFSPGKEYILGERYRETLCPTCSVGVTYSLFCREAQL